MSGRSRGRKTPANKRAMLFGLWGRVCKAQGWSGAEVDVERAEFTASALGVDREAGEEIPSWSGLSEDQISVLKEGLEAALGEWPLEEAVKGSGRAPEGKAAAWKRRQLVWGIEQDMVAAYSDLAGAEQALRTICASVSGDASPGALGRWRELPLDGPGGLRNLRKTAGRCRRAQFSKIGENPAGKAADLQDTGCLV